jgi:hypothetical protein
MANLSFKIKLLHNSTLPIKEVDSDMTIRELVDSVIIHQEYPLQDDGQKDIEYYLENGKGERLSLDDTLTQAGVQIDEVLTMRSSSAHIPPPRRGEQTPAPAGMVNAYVQLLDLNRTELESFPLDKKVGEVLNEIIQKHKLPARDVKLKEGKFYQLFSKAFGSVMHEGMTLREAKVPNFDTLIVSTKEVPG